MHVRPERVYVWPTATSTNEPELLDSHMEEVRSGHDEEPRRRRTRPPRAAGARGTRAWRSSAPATAPPCCRSSPPTASRSRCACRCAAERGERLIRIEGDPVGAPLEPGLACITAHEHGAELDGQRNFQVRGDLVEDGDGWALVPHQLVGGFELPPSGALARTVMNLPKVFRFRRTAKRELARRGR